MNRTIIIVVSAAALAVAGCGTKVEGKPANDPAPTSSAAASSAPATTTTTAAETKTGDGGTTPTGTTLTVGQTATVNYAIKDLSKETTKLEVTAVSAKKGAIADLKNFNLDAQTKVSDPFYVTLKFRNAGPKPMSPSGIFGLVNVHNTAGDEINRLSLIGTFKPCEGTPPDTLAVGDAFTECDVYIAPAGQSIGKVVFGFYVDLDHTEITWNVA